MDVHVNDESVSSEAVSETSEQRTVSDVDWEQQLKKENSNYYYLSRSGSKYMTPQDIALVVNILSRLNFTMDPFIETYYFYKMMERKDASFTQRAGNPFFNHKQKDEIAIRERLRSVAFLNSVLGNSLGVNEYRDSRKQVKQIDVGLLDFDKEPVTKEQHFKTLELIEYGYSSSLRAEQSRARLEHSTNPFEELFLKQDIIDCESRILKAFSLEKVGEQYELKPKGLIRMMSIRKGKKLFLASLSHFDYDIWCKLLSVLLPYVLIWTKDESQREITDKVLLTIKEFLESQYVDLNFLSTVLDSFIQQKTYPLIYMLCSVTILLNCFLCFLIQKFIPVL